MKSSATAALTLSAEIRSRFDEFSRSQKDDGQYIVDHLDEASFHTAEELARRANTSSSTVVRFAQALGFEGFPELQSAARDEYRRAREGEQGTVDLANPPLFPIDQTEFEAALAADGGLRAYRHEGFWECMDTYKDAVQLNDLWDGGQAPWRRW